MNDAETNYRRLLHILDAERPDWVKDAACRGMGPELFFPERGEDASTARAVCAGCPVAAECAEYGATERFGIWGGVTPYGRRNPSTIVARTMTHGTVSGYNLHSHRREAPCDECREAYTAYRRERYVKRGEAA
jgi:WhiB family redox-sensing transcriptional regulator